MISREMSIGKGNRLTRNLWWNLFRHRYLIHTGDPYYIPWQQDISTVVPAISYTHHFRWGIWYTVPALEGLFMVTSSGDIQLLSLEEAQEHPALEGNVVFPEELARI